MAGSAPKQDIGNLIGLALWRWGRTSPRRMGVVSRITWRLLLAELRRRRQQRRIGVRIPWVLAISPTMRCNYGCQGCYSRGRSTENELTTAELDELISEAESLGIISVVVTGGEPLLRDDMVELITRHRRLLFVIITNGSLVTEKAAGNLARSGNVVPLVSLEGLPCDTDERRAPNAHSKALQAMRYLREAGLCFGFAAMNTTANTEHLGSDEFIQSMTAQECSLGFFTEYVPCDSEPRRDWTLDERARDAFRERVLKMKRRERIVLVQFPHDEYGEENRCTAAGQASLHISSRGEVEPCPFVSISCDNVRDGGLTAGCLSPFMQAIRSDPELLRRNRLACSLFEHRQELLELAREFAGAPDGDTDDTRGNVASAARPRAALEDAEARPGGGSAPERAITYKENFTLLLEELRSQLDAAGDYLLTIAAPASPTIMENIEVDQIHQYLDWINVMTYDFHGPWGGEADPVTNFNSPLFVAPDDPLPEPYHSSFNLEAAVQAYLGHGVPAEKIRAGLAFCGRGFGNVAGHNNGLFADYSGPAPVGTWENGVFDYWDLKQHYVNANGYTSFWHDDARVQWLHGPSAHVTISDDDVTSIGEKCEFINASDIGGAVFWEFSCDRYGELVSTIYNTIAEPGGSSVDDDGAARGGYALELLANHPSPFDQETTISFELRESAHVVVAVYDTAGRLVRQLASHGTVAGHYSIKWDGTDAAGHGAASGTYMYKVTAGESSRTGRLLLIR